MNIVKRQTKKALECLQKETRFFFELPHKKYAKNILLFSIIIIAFLIVPLTLVNAQESSGWADGTLGRVFNWIAELLFKSGSLLLGVVGTLLDYSVQFSLNTDNYAKKAVEGGWSVLRDVANIAFIFILLYIAIGTILRLDKINTKQAFVNVIIIAFLINFSLFFTQIVIDASNILAAFFYNNATSITVDGTKSNLGTILAAALSPQSIFDSAALKQLSFSSAGVGNIVGFIAVLLAAFSFLAVTIMFIIRTAALIILMALSPLAFVAYILDDFREYFMKWWSTLLHQSFFAPVYLLMIFIVILIIRSDGFQSALGDRSLAKGVNALASVAQAAGSDSVNSFSVFFAYFLILFLIHGAYLVAKQLGGATAALGTKWAGKGLGLAMGGAAAVGRRTLGRGFAAFSRSEGLKEAAARGGIGGFAARLALRSAEGGAKGSYDFRGGKVGDLLGAGAGTIGADLGRAGGKGGFEAIRKEQINKEMATAKSLGEATFSRKETEDIREFEELVSIQKEKIERAEKAKDTAGEAVATQELARLNKEFGKLTGRGTERVKTYASKVEGERSFLSMDPKTKREAAKRMRAELGKTPERKLQDQLAGYLGKLAEQGGGKEAEGLAKSLGTKPKEKE
ncbi:MAG: hypothetical protein Q8R36_02725 [bacterium]|nr:hypothetical protein [bacterium]